jgi:hypothetical protein
LTRKILRVNGVDVRSREFRVRQAVASARLEGHAVSPGLLELFQRYVDRETTYAEVVARVNAGEFDEAQGGQRPAG